MERIYLTKSEKLLLRTIANTRDVVHPELTPASRAAAARSLEAKGFIHGAYIEGGDIEAAMLLPAGRDYINANPKLYNPINWMLVCEAIIAACAVIGTVAGIVACSMIN